VCFIAKPLHGATLIHLVKDAVERSRTGKGPIVVPAATMPPGESRPSPEPRASDRGLTPRQQEVLEHLVQGKSNREIAEALSLSENTVKVHLAAVFRTLGVSSRSEALLAGMKALRQTS
jgi:DNA-binding NarL/FixJ family response regulator